MKNFLSRIICFFKGHQITDHKVYDYGGEYYCPRCKRHFEYYEDFYYGIIEHEVHKGKK